MHEFPLANVRTLNGLYEVRNITIAVYPAVAAER